MFRLAHSRMATTLFWTGRSDLGRLDPGGRGLSDYVHRDPAPPHSLSERPVQHAMDPGDRPRCERLVAPSAPAQEVGVEVVDVLGGDLAHAQMPEVRIQVAVDDGPGVGGGRDGPARGSDLEPVLEQVGDGAGPEPSPPCLLRQVLELRAGEPLRAVNGLGEPALLAGDRVDPHIDPKLPDVLAALRFP